MCNVIKVLWIQMTFFLKFQVTTEQQQKIAWKMWSLQQKVFIFST